MRTLIAILALAGAVVAAMALRVHYSNETEPCSINEKWDCGVVNHSPYAEILHIPVAAIGIAGYLTLGVLALLRRRKLLAVLACAALAFSLYLTNIERTVLQVYCLYCVISLAIITFIAAVSVFWTFTSYVRHRRSARNF
jgi:vitamin-K-epoxide reductase (warfarin-sensitive)